MIKRIAVVKWSQEDGISNAFREGLTELGYEPVLFLFNKPIPTDVDMVLSYAPYGKFLPLASQMSCYDPRKRPVFIHWNTENPPNPKIPWLITRQIASFRSWIDRMSDSPRLAERSFADLKPMKWLQQKGYRFRYIGDYRYAYSKGWLDLLVEASPLYTRDNISHGIPSAFVPWGTCREWYANLNLERDVDVLWFGKRRIKPRSDMLDSIRQQLQARGIKMHVIDGVENPFIFGSERTQLLNRSKIVLNLQIYPYDNVYPYRFHVVAGNRSLMVCEKEMDHHTHCIAGKHYIGVEADQIVEQILYYLCHDGERKQITENAYQLVTQELTMTNSMKAIVFLGEAMLNKATGPRKRNMY